MPSPLLFKCLCISTNDTRYKFKGQGGFTKLSSTESYHCYPNTHISHGTWRSVSSLGSSSPGFESSWENLSTATREAIAPYSARLESTELQGSKWQRANQLVPPVQRGISKTEKCAVMTQLLICYETVAGEAYWKCENIPVFYKVVSPKFRSPGRWLWSQDNKYGIPAGQIHLHFGDMKTAFELRSKPFFIQIWMMNAIDQLWRVGKMTPWCNKKMWLFCLVNLWPPAIWPVHSTSGSLQSREAPGPKYMVRGVSPAWCEIKESQH